MTVVRVVTCPMINVSDQTRWKLPNCRQHTITGWQIAQHHLTHPI